MKSVLMSIHPEYCRKIFSGEKHFEIRKYAPKIPCPYTVYVYETKKEYVKWQTGAKTSFGYGSGKVIGRFVCAYISTLNLDSDVLYDAYMNYVCHQTCLSLQELKDYVNGKDGTLLYIDSPRLFDRPKELSEFGSLINTIDWERGTVNLFKGNKFYKPMKRPPVSWCYVEEI